MTTRYWSAPGSERRLRTLHRRLRDDETQSGENAPRRALSAWTQFSCILCARVPSNHYGLVTFSADRTSNINSQDFRRAANHSSWLFLKVPVATGGASKEVDITTTATRSFSAGACATCSCLFLQAADSRSR